MTSVACVIIAGPGTRSHLLRERGVPSALAQGFDEVVVVGTYEPGEGYRYLDVPSLTGTTLDALVKRDVGTLNCESKLIVYLCDDHMFIGRGFAKTVRAGHKELWDVIVPSRWADHPTLGRIRINNGERDGYCGGHAGVFRREVIQHRPWSAMPHDRLWDLHASRIQQDAGFRFLSVAGLAVQDIEGGRPWE